MTEPCESRYQTERDFFDRVAANAVIAPMSRAVLERYACPRYPELFAKEKMFALLGQARGQKLLEVGCGEGIASVQLAYRGADVLGVDLSPESVERSPGAGPRPTASRLASRSSTSKPRTWVERSTTSSGAT
jgi:2-polyprenyl-3-methyl-5-hydroxy-6-metoxy-1,4-benzoquinol methylase